jgi:hypothetical protein
VALGISRSVEELEKLCRTSATDGTQTKNIVRAAATIEGCVPVRLLEKRTDIALLKLAEALRRGRPVIMAWCTAVPGDHWIAAIGLLGDRYLLADSADSELVTSMSVDEVEERWRDTKYEAVIL